MRNLTKSLLAIGASPLVAWQAPPAAAALPPPPPPPVRIAPLDPVAAQQHALALLTWMPGEVRCAGQPVTGGTLRRPLNGLTSRSNLQRPVPYRFAIDAAGRPVSIARNGDAFLPLGDDIAPALATSRFPAGRAQSDCNVTYAPTLHPLAEAPPADLASYTISPTGSRLPPEGWKRLMEGGTCRNRPSPRPLLRAYPDFEKLPATPGVRDWSLVGFDIDAKGQPVKLRIVHTTGNGALDAASLDAVGESRFTAGPRTGCLYPYHRSAATLAAPEKPDEESFRPATSTCPVKSKWAVPPPRRYPENYRRRSIEGWAVVTYDVAPWGEVGNIRVAASQPTEDFGKQAAAMLRSARVEASAQGASGCIETVRFSMQRTGPGRTMSDNASDNASDEDAGAPEAAIF